jgi:sugar transferase (PEP-CTERM/EpsH1 system associated)
MVVAAVPEHSSGLAAAPAEAIRVMHVVHTYGVGGMEVGITKLVNALDRTRVTSSICSCCPGDSLKNRLDPEIRLFELNRKPGNDPKLVAQLYRLLRRERPHVLHTHRWATLCEGLIAARLAGVPFVVHGEHGTLETRRHNAFVQRTVWKRVDQVLSVSSRLAERMAREISFPLDRIKVIRNGVDTTRFRPGGGAAARQALGVSPDALIIGAVGRLVPVKDYPTLLRALALLRERGVAFESIIAGTGPLRDELTALAISLGLANVRFLGNRNDIEHVLPAFDVFVLSSSSEGLSNTIQEAMAAGLPVVATRVGGADELVDESGTGLLVPPGNPEALAHALGSLAQDAGRRRSMGDAGRRRAESVFGIDIMIREYERLYLSLGTRTGATLARVEIHEA